MSKNNDEMVKKMLTSNEIPKELEPENIKAMLDRKKIKKKTGMTSTVIKVVSGAAACAVVCTFATNMFIQKGKLRNSTDKEALVSDILINSSENELTRVEAEMYMQGAPDYSRIYSYIRKPEKQNAFDKMMEFFSGGKIEYKNDIYDGAGDDFVYEEYNESFEESFVDTEVQMNGALTDGVLNSVDSGYVDSGTKAPETSGSGSDLREEEDNEYSDTYNQEEGVEEADIVKTDGKNIYYCFEDEIRIASVDSGKFTSTNVFSPKADLNIEENEWFNIRDIYLIDDKLIVVSSSFEESSNEYYTYDTKTGIIDCVVGSVGSSEEVSVSVYKTGLEPEFIASYTQEGAYSDIRMIDGYVYLITNTTSDFYNQIKDVDDIDSYIPKYGCNGNDCFIPADDILIPEEERTNLSQISYTVIGGMNVLSDTPSENVKVKALADYTGTIYCSKDNLYAAAFTGEDTSITRISISEGNINPSASGKVDGYVLNQFSMSEYNGYFRIATTINNTSEESNALFILDMDMNTVGQVTDFGLNETIKSVNYNGDLAYVVTYEQTDPLFAIDTSNPENPVILDEFKINGYSTYMQKWNDGLLLGFGIDADENAIERGVKLVMFDTSDPNELKEIGLTTYSSTEEYIYSSAIWERKNLYIDSKRNLISFPLSIYGYEAEFKNVFYSYENGQFTLKGEVDLNSEYDVNSRVLYINGYLYLITDAEFKSLNVDTIEVIDSFKW